MIRIIDYMPEPIAELFIWIWYSWQRSRCGMKVCPICSPRRDQLRELYPLSAKTCRNGHRLNEILVDWNRVLVDVNKVSQILQTGG